MNAPLTASDPPVKNPAIMALQSTLFRWVFRFVEQRSIILPRIFFLPDTFHGTVVSTEQSSPNSKIAAQDRGTSLYGSDRSNKSLTLASPSVLRQMAQAWGSKGREDKRVESF